MKNGKENNYHSSSNWRMAKKREQPERSNDSTGDR